MQGECMWMPSWNISMPEVSTGTMTHFFRVQTVHKLHSMSSMRAIEEKKREMRESWDHDLEFSTQILSNSLPCLCATVSNTIELVATRRWATKRRRVTDAERAAQGLPAMIRSPHECWIRDQIRGGIHHAGPPIILRTVTWNPGWWSPACLHPKQQNAQMSVSSLTLLPLLPGGLHWNAQQQQQQLCYKESVPIMWLWALHREENVSSDVSSKERIHVHKKNVVIAI